MLRPRGALSLLAVVGALAACDDTPDAGPTAPQPQLQLSGLTCKPANVQKLARSLFGNGSAAANYAQQLTSNQTTNVPIVFNIFREIATKAAPGLTGQQRLDAANLNVQSIACAAVVSSDPLASSDLAAFTQGFAKAVEFKGAYAVRGSSSNDNADVKSHNASASETGASGIQAPTGATGGFLNWQGGQVLFYGSPGSSFSAEAGPSVGRVVFDWFTVKPVTAATNGDLSGKLGICVNYPGTTETKLRVQHGQTILPIAAFEVCQPPFVVDRGRPRTVLEWFGRAFAPSELHAALLATTSPGSTAKKFSPYEVVNPGIVQIAFEHAPADGFVGQPIPSVDAPLPITVSAKGAVNTPWEGVSIQIYGVNNNGLKQPFTNDVAVTDSTGLASFNLVASPKTGGFNLYAVTVPSDQDVANFVPDTVAAPLRINIRP
jgi:hypothetical protein